MTDVVSMSIRGATTARFPPTRKAAPAARTCRLFGCIIGSPMGALPGNRGDGCWTGKAEQRANSVQGSWHAAPPPQPLGRDQLLQAQPTSVPTCQLHHPLAHSPTIALLAVTGQCPCYMILCSLYY